MNEKLLKTVKKNTVKKYSGKHFLKKAIKSQQDHLIVKLRKALIF